MSYDARKHNKVIINILIEAGFGVKKVYPNKLKQGRRQTFTGGFPQDIEDNNSRLFGIPLVELIKLEVVTKITDYLDEQGVKFSELRWNPRSDFIPLPEELKKRLPYLPKNDRLHLYINS